MSKEKRIYSLRYEAIGWEVDAFLNEIPALLNARGGGQLPVVNFVKDGPNVLRFAARRLEDPAPPSIGFSLVSSPCSDPAEVSVIVKFAGPLEGKEVVSQEWEFRGASTLQWAWERATEVEKLCAKDKATILSQVDAFYDALVAKDGHKILTLRKSLLEEMSKWRKMELEQFRKERLAFWRGIFSDSMYTVERLPNEKLCIEPYGPVVRVGAKVNGRQDQRGKPIIEINLTPTGKQTRKSQTFRRFFFSKINEKWRLLY